MTAGAAVGIPRPLDAELLADLAADEAADDEDLLADDEAELTAAEAEAMAEATLELAELDTEETAEAMVMPAWEPLVVVWAAAREPRATRRSVLNCIFEFGIGAE